MVKIFFQFSLILVLGVWNSLGQQKNSTPNDFLHIDLDELNVQHQRDYCKSITESIEPCSNERSLCQCQKRYPNSCSEATAGSKKNGIYSIQLNSFHLHPFLVFCDATTQGGGWTLSQRRTDGSMDFYRNWADYKVGFGNLVGEFFIGLDKLHAMTTATPQELLIVMTDWNNITKYAKYDAFAIGDERQSYALNVLGAYSGDAGDSLTYHVAQKFSTYDNNNDISNGNCAVSHTGAWWYTPKTCFHSNLNGLYLEEDKQPHKRGVIWSTWHPNSYSLKTVNMLIRPKTLN